MINVSSLCLIICLCKFIIFSSNNLHGEKKFTMNVNPRPNSIYKYSIYNIGIFTRKLFAGNKYIYLFSFVLIIKIICNKMQKIFVKYAKSDRKNRLEPSILGLNCAKLYLIMRH